MKRILITITVVILVVIAAHITHHLDWFWTGNPASIIGGNGLAIGDLHIFIH